MSLDGITVGDSLTHKVFGRGLVRDVEVGEKVVVDFSGQERTFMWDAPLYRDGETPPEASEERSEGRVAASAAPSSDTTSKDATRARELLGEALPLLADAASSHPEEDSSDKANKLAVANAASATKDVLHSLELREEMKTTKVKAAQVSESARDRYQDTKMKLEKAIPLLERARPLIRQEEDDDELRDKLKRAIQRVKDIPPQLEAGAVLASDDLLGDTLAELGNL